jgi:hypothetical protein
MLHQAPDYAHQFLGSFGLHLGFASNHAMVSVIFEQPKGNLVEGGLDRGDLGHDIDAVSVFVDHSLNAANLAFDPA